MFQAQAEEEEEESSISQTIYTRIQSLGVVTVNMIRRK